MAVIFCFRQYSKKGCQIPEGRSVVQPLNLAEAWYSKSSVSAGSMKPRASFLKAFLEGPICGMTSATRQAPSLPVRSTFFVSLQVCLSAGQSRGQRFRLKDYKFFRAAHDRALGLQKDRYPWAPVTAAQEERRRDLPSLAEKGGWSCH